MEESDISMKDEERDKDKEKTSKNDESSPKNKKLFRLVFKTKKRKKNDFLKGNNFFNFEFTQINFDKDKNENENDNIIKDEVKDFKIIDMDENDKMFMNIYNYLKNHTDLNKNEIIMINNKIVFPIIKLSPYYIIKKDNTLYAIDKKSREIKFVDYKLKKITIKFIHNCDNLIVSLKNLGFTSYYVKLPKYNNEDSSIISSLNEEDEISSENSEVSLSDPFSIFNNDKIKYIFNENQRPILTEDNYKNTFCYQLEYLKDLNNNSKYYYGKYKECSFQIINNYENADKNLSQFQFSQQSKILYLYGPKGSSKTTLLFYMINNYRIYKTKTIYFNHNYLKKKNFLEVKKRIYHELLYFCKDIEEMEQFKAKKIFGKTEGSDKIMAIIYIVLSNLFEIIGEEIEYRRLVIIDNINDMDKDDINYLNDIIQLFDKKKIFFKLIICGNGSYFNQKFIEFYIKNNVLSINSNFDENQLTEFFYLYNADKDEIKNIIDENNKKINLNKKEIEEELISKEEKEIDKYSFYFLYFAEELDNKTFTRETIIQNIDFIKGMPLEYFEITLTGNNMNFKFYSNLFKKCFKNKIAVEIEKDTLTKLLMKNDYPRTFFGICFEKLITLLLMHNKLNVENLIFKKNSIKEIKEIAMLKEKNYTGPKFNNEEINTPILIIQENFFGPLYDLVIITKHNNLYYSDFIQIGVDKDKDQINKIIKDLENNYSIYKQNILKIFGIQTNFISVLFIFDLKTQEKGQYLLGTKLCKEFMIDSYLFSFEDCSLYELYNTDNNNNLIKVIDYFPSFVINEDRKKENYPINLNKKRKKKSNKGNNKITNFFHFK